MKKATSDFPGSCWGSAGTLLQLPLSDVRPHVGTCRDRAGASPVPGVCWWLSPVSALQQDLMDLPRELQHCPAAARSHTGPHGVISNN